ncbi:hypothetical protein [Streptomyces sp. NPDC020742]|uniref:hypothetical protein n=1 Tax=unclassified Streptomyces TaxID=2593676 RepID=UPI0033F34F5F
MQASKRRIAGRITAIALGLSICGAATPAFADQDIKVIWAHAYRVNSNHGQAAIKDTADDGNEVYVQYTRAGHGNKVYTLWNKKGGGHTTYSGGGAKVTIKKICRSIDAWPDTCFTHSA